MLDFYQWLKSSPKQALADELQTESTSFSFSCPQCKYHWRENLVIGSFPRRGRCPKCRAAGAMPFRRF
jgi:hypothetical protein